MGAEKLGEYLRRERELRGITLEEISQGTKISKRLLEYMEAGRWDELPGEIFAKGFLKSYAEFIGLSTEEILLRYEEEKKIDQDEREIISEGGPQGGPQKNTIIFVACLVLAIIIGYLSYMLIQKDLWVESKNPEKKPQVTSSINASNTAQGINGSSASGNTHQDGETHRE